MKCKNCDAELYGDRVEFAVKQQFVHEYKGVYCDRVCFFIDLLRSRQMSEDEIQKAVEKIYRKSIVFGVTKGKLATALKKAGYKIEEKE